MLARIRGFYGSFFSVGDRLGEAFYGVWMAVVSIGLLNSVGEITPDHIVWVVWVAFIVNLGWGIIDGVTVMLTNIIERAKRDRIIHDLQSKPLDVTVEQGGLASLDGTIVSALHPAEKRRIIEALAKGDPGADPTGRPYRANRNDLFFAVGIAAIDVIVVVPILAPLLLISDVSLAVYVSRLVATLLFAGLGAAYATNLHRNPWLAALLVGTLGFGLFTLAYEAGW